jgi:hypothetical protein
VEGVEHSETVLEPLGPAVLAVVAMLRRIMAPQTLVVAVQEQVHRRGMVATEDQVCLLCDTCLVI